MVKRGGSATVYGVLYQMLGSIRWAVQLRIEGEVQDDELVAATLILEPDAGDVEVRSTAKRIVEQWKARTTDRSWTILEIIRHVLPDLYRAVDPDWLNRPCEFRFVTEGNCADWSVAKGFFDWVKQQPSHDDPLTLLDDSLAQPYLGTRSPQCTARDFFMRILESVTGNAYTHSTGMADRHAVRRLWHLLGRFDVISGRSKHNLESEIDAILRNYVDYPGEDVPAKRAELCGRILEWAAEGATLTPDEFFHKANLNRTALRNWSTVFDELNRRTQVRLREHLHYDSDLDVRPPDGWPRPRPIMLITGESGQGKSWRLAALARTHDFPDAAVVQVRATGNARETLRIVADFLWKTGFGRQRDMALESIADCLRSCDRDFPKPWLLVLIDEVRSDQEARDLAEFAWEEHGIQVAMVVPETAAKVVSSQHATRAAMDRVTDFEPRDLREYLRRRGFVWGDLPTDTRSILLRPLLAHLYCTVADESVRLPTDEYSLFHAVWKQITQKHPSHAADDSGCLLDLVMATLKGDAEYPWTVASCKGVALEREAIQRLVDAGWLARDEGRIRFWHTRLLNWAVAAALARFFRHQGEDVFPLIERVLGIPSDAPRPLAGEDLGYVPMDLLWLACDEDQGKAACAHPVLSIVDRTYDASSVARDELYGELLPTLGPRIARVLVRFFHERQPGPDLYQVRQLRRSLLAIAEIFPEDAQAVSLEMLDDECMGIQAAAASVLRRLPTGNALDGLWRLLQSVREMSTSASRQLSENLDRVESLTIKALGKCVSSRPQWIASKIAEKPIERESLRVLVELLSGADGDDACDVWTEVAPIAVRALGDGSWGLAGCIDRFAAQEHLELLEQWAVRDNLDTAPTSVVSLTAVATDRAIQLLPRIPRRVLHISRTSWLPLLIEADADATRDQLRGMMDSSEKACDDCAGVFSGQTGLLDVATVRLFLDRLSCMLANKETAKPGAIYRPEGRMLQLVAEVSDYRLLDELSRWRDSSLEQRLVHAACAWAEDSNSCQFDLDAALQVLLRIRGSGFTALVNALLRCESKTKRLEGLRWAVAQPDSNTKSLLREIALADVADDGQIPKPWILTKHAVGCLALLGEDGALIEAALKQEVPIFDTMALRHEHPPMSDESIAPAIDALRSSDEERQARALKALGLTGRPDLIPRFKDVLRASPTESSVGFGALVALAALRANDDEAIQFFSEHLRIRKHLVAAANGLLFTERGDARQALLRHMQQHYVDAPFSLDDQIVLRLCEYPDTRDGAMTLVAPLIKAFGDYRNRYRPLEYLDLLAEIGDSGTEDILREEADPAEGISHVVGRRARAIRSLARRAPLDAFEAAQRALVRGKHDRAHFPELLVELDAERAVPFLCEQFHVERNMLVRRAIALALRRSGCCDLIRRQVVDWLTRGDAQQRSSAAELVGWMPPSFLESEIRARLRDERLASARQSMCHSLSQLRRQAAAMELVSRLKHAVGLERRSYIEMLMDMVDPSFLGKRNDPLWLGNVSDDWPEMCHRRANELLHSSVKKLDRDLESRTTD